MKKNEVVLITGASAGIGRATVRRFARDGAHIGLVARGEAGLVAAKREVEELGGEALVLPVDVADAAALEAAAAAVEERFGPIDIWINAAMLSVFSPVAETKPEEFRRVTEVTYLGFVYGTLSALRRMLPRDRGMIVQVGSALGYRGIPLQAAYCGAKHAIQGFTEALRCELLHDGSHVRVTMVQLPAVNTTQFGWVKSRLPRKAQPVPPIFQPELIAEAIHHAAHHYRRELYVGWPTVEAIVGNKIAPNYADHYLARHGYDSQQTDEPRDPNAPNNLWQPVDATRDYGAHGTFDDRAHDFSAQLWANLHRGTLAMVGAAALGLALALRPAEGKDGHRGPDARKRRSHRVRPQADTVGQGSHRRLDAAIERLESRTRWGQA